MREIKTYFKGAPFYNAFIRSGETCPRFVGAAVGWTIRPEFPRGLRLGRLLGALATHLRFNDLLLSAHPIGNDLIV